jgi:hypothetical protein
MKTYNKRAIREWFGRAFGIEAETNDELKTFCPYCRHPNFYFNIKKQIGWCHRASCHNKPSLDDLIFKAGYSPDEFGGFFNKLIEEEKKISSTIELPGTKVLFYEEGTLMTSWPETVNYLIRRGLDEYDILRFGLTCDGRRVYVPVYRGDTLENYVSRDLTGFSERKYLYAPGRKTTKWLFGWDEAIGWPTLTLVENTFVSIWLRDKLHCSTNFGSYLSEEQAKLIQASKVNNVVILWDEGAHVKALRAVKLLRKHGINAAFAYMKGQPDDHPFDLIYEITENTCRAAMKNEMFYDHWNLEQETLRKDYQNDNNSKSKF